MQLNHPKSLKIVSSNQQLSDGIELYLNNIENGKIDPKALEDSIV
ncbi:DUF6376 family protein [Peribacillus simplex]